MDEAEVYCRPDSTDDSNLASKVLDPVENFDENAERSAKVTCETTQPEMTVDTLSCKPEKSEDLVPVTTIVEASESELNGKGRGYSASRTSWLATLGNWIFGRNSLTSTKVAPNDELLPIAVHADPVKNEPVDSPAPTPVALELIAKHETIVEVREDTICPSPQVAVKALHRKKKRSSIASSHSHKFDVRKKSRTKLKKVHFLLPKVSAAKESSFWKPYDPKIPLIRRWLIVMLLPLSYEIWAFPYRLALGFPSIKSKICLADLLCDCFFVADIYFALCTLIPRRLGHKDSITTFSGICLHYLAKTFPLELLPSVAYWIMTVLCVSHLHGICPDDHDPGPDELDFAEANPDATRRAVVRPIAAGNGTGAKYLYWQCVVQHQGWPIWVWWVFTVPRFVPRLNRLMAYFKSMESDLVSLFCACDCLLPKDGQSLSVPCLVSRRSA